MGILGPRALNKPLVLRAGIFSCSSYQPHLWGFLYGSGWNLFLFLKLWKAWQGMLSAGASC